VAALFGDPSVVEHHDLVVQQVCGEYLAACWIQVGGGLAAR
jgi:hypothetical protein